MSNTAETPHKEEEEEEEEETTFENLGLDPRLVNALAKAKENLSKPTPIQRVAIPLILEGKNVVAQAKTGSGKTLAYILPLLHKLFSESSSSKKATAPTAFILVPTRDLVPQVHSVLLSIIDLCLVQLKVVKVTAGMTDLELRSALAGPPDILVSTPACISACMKKDVLAKDSIKDSLSFLVLDEADLLLSYGHKEDLEVLISVISRRCQCLLMSATLSDDVEWLKKHALHSPVSLTLTEEDGKDDIVPSNVQQFWISCNARDKLLYALALLKLGLVQKKVLIFVNAIDTGFRLKLFLEQFGLKSAVLNAELPQNSRHHILEEFNAGLFDYLIATDDNKTKEDQVKKPKDSTSTKSKKHLKQKLDSEFGVVRGIDFKNVYTVINFDMPRDTPGYVHRIGRTGRAHNTGASVSLVSTDEMELFEDIKTTLGETEESSNFAPFPLLTKNAVESLRYRAEDVAKSVTKVAIRESRAQELRNEILNSEKLKAHFEDNPKDLDLLKHDKMLSKKAPPGHLRAVPEYLLDPTTQEASKIVKLARAAMGKNKNSSRRQGSKNKFKKSGGDPLMAFSSEGARKFSKGGQKRNRGGEKDGGRKSRRKTTETN